MIFKRRKHKLPKFPQEVIPTFRALCQKATQEELKELRASLDDSFKELFQAATENEYIDLDEAKLLYERCLYLLESFNEYPPDKQKLIVGAVSYVAISDDPFNETIFASGFHDDKLIMNYVLEDLGIEGKYLPVS